MTADTRATDGRQPGRRGLETRRRLLDQTAELLATTSYRDLKVTDIARAAGTSPATFYQYFADVTDAVANLGEGIRRDAEAVAEVAAGDWTDGATAGRLVAAFESFWDRHGSVMRVIDLATFEGDARFAELRTDALNAITESLRAAMREAGASDPDAKATAGVVVAMLAHVSAHRDGFDRWGVERPALDGALARMVGWAVTSGAEPA